MMYLEIEILKIILYKYKCNNKFTVSDKFEKYVQNALNTASIPRSIYENFQPFHWNFSKEFVY